MHRAPVRKRRPLWKRVLETLVTEMPHPSGSRIIVAQVLTGSGEVIVVH